MKTILFDIDGTLADIEHRRGFLLGDLPDWRAFNAAMGDDTPNLPVVSLYKSLWATQSFEIILVSGRNEKYRKITEQWLVWNEIPFGRLLMRMDNDNRADYLIKKEILNQLISEGKNIEFAVDDRQQVVDMWRENGITCFQCDKGDF
ncbi:MAG: polynucleotide kinase [Rhodobacteraceae bacterium]|nr:polynucleotide kinase [Paracoccaceae bacterium]